MGVKTGVQRWATVILWLSVAWAALGIVLLISHVSGGLLTAVGIFWIPAASGLLTAYYMLDGFGSKKDNED